MQWKGICSKTPCDCLVVLLWCSVSRLVRTKEANLNHVPRPTFVVVQLYSEASGMSVVSLLVGQCVVCHDAFWYLSVTVCIYFFLSDSLHGHKELLKGLWTRLMLMFGFFFFFLSSSSVMNLYLKMEAQLTRPQPNSILFLRCYHFKNWRRDNT